MYMAIFRWGDGTLDVRHMRRVVAKAKPDRRAFGLRLQGPLSHSAVSVLDPRRCGLGDSLLPRPSQVSLVGGSPGG